MGFLSDVGDAVTGIVGGITGLGAVDAAKNASRYQQKAAQQGIDEQRGATAQMMGLFDPYAQAGAQQLPQMLDFLNPQNQANYIMNNPLFQTLAQDTQNRVFGNQAARGKLGSGGTAVELGNQLLPLAMNMGQQQFTNMSDVVNRGYNAAGNQSNVLQGSTNNIIDLITGKANARAAGADFIRTY